MSSPKSTPTDSFNVQHFSNNLRIDDQISHGREPVDFIATLPYDILTTTLSLLPTKDLVELLYVSKTWRRCVMDCSELWKSIILYENEEGGGNDNNNNDVENNKMKSPTILFNKPTSLNVQDIRLSLPSLPNCNDVLFTRMKEGCFPRLKTLHLNGKIHTWV